MRRLTLRGMRSGLRIAFAISQAGWNSWLWYKLMPSKAALLAIGIPAILLGGAVAFAASRQKGGSFFSAIAVPSDSSLVSKYGLTNPKDNIQNFALTSLGAMRIQYAQFTPSCAGGSQTSGAARVMGTVQGFISQVPVVGNFLGDAVGFITSIFDHHAQAVAKEQSTLCAATFAFNQAMDSFDQALAGGQYQASDAPSAYQGLFEKLVFMTAAVAQGCPSTSARGTGAAAGNEACVVNRIGQAILEKRLAQLGVGGEVQ